MKKILLMFMAAALMLVGCEDSAQLDYHGYNPNTGQQNPDDDKEDPEKPDDPKPDDPTPPQTDYPVLAEGENAASLPLISTNPTFVSQDMTANVVVRFNLAGTDMDTKATSVYAHTGVITNLSTATSDWKYVVVDWGVNDPKVQLFRHEQTSIWYMILTGGPRAYYGVPEDEQIQKLAFVLRSGDKNTAGDVLYEVKDNGNDIFYELVEGELNVSITTPQNGTVWEVGQTYDVKAKAVGAKSLKLYMNEEVIGENTTGAEITYQYTPSAPIDLTFKAVASNGETEVEDVVKVSVLGAVENQPRPSGAKEGVSFNGNDATFVLYAPGKKSVSLLGDFNQFSITNEHLMKKDGDYFWVTVTDLDPNFEYAYQYLVDGSIKVGDPYSEKILDPWNDKWITASVYPNLREYPSETTDIVSCFTINEPEYNWTVTNFQRPAENSLAVYELLIRDFTTERSIDAVTAKLDYLEELGINAIELMPIQEFDGNDSWGYNPCFYFAPDKAYGTEEAYKRFIDACHQRGIAVILDVVFNHSTGQFPWAKMWWNSSANKTASDNPFFNVDAPHNWSVYHDFNHTYPKTRTFFKEVLQYWLKEYKVDGFRFDLTKGLVQNPGNYDAGGYSAERIGILKDYANAIREVTPDAYIIFEHFVDQSEETELYNSVGALCWNNAQLEGYMESVMGWYEGGSTGGAKIWGLMGDFQNNNWSNDILFAQSGNLMVAQDVIFADANKEGCVFKVRENRSWDVSYGVTDGAKKYGIGEQITLNGTANALVNAQVGVKYDFYFDPATMKVWVMNDGATPSSLRRNNVTRANTGKSNFSDFKRGRMNNIETHDEERIAYKAITYGQTWVASDWTVISKHLQAAYAFHFLTPYPKMLWQFGELGYDFSINSNESGVVGSGDDYRTHRKPIRWDYVSDPNRSEIYETLSKVLEFRNQQEAYYGQDNLAVHTWNVGDGDMAGKTLVMDKVVMVANFTNAPSSTVISVPSAGQWRNLLTGEKVNLSSSQTVNLGASDFVIYVRD